MPHALCPPAFIVGMPRSGTTLLAEMLATQPGVGVPPETHFFSVCTRGLPVDEPLADPAAALGCLDRFLYPNGSPDETPSAERTAPAEPASPIELFVDELDRWAQSGGWKQWVEKTPAHLDRMPAILDVLADARAAVVVRDPRAVHASLHRTPWDREDVVGHALRWQRYARTTRALVEAHPGRVLAVPYERLVTVPAEAVAEVCAHLALPFDAGALEKRVRGEGRSFDQKAEPWKARASAPLDPGRIDGWKREVGAAERALIERVAGDEMERFGYAPSSGALSVADRVRVAGYLAAFVPRRVANKLYYYRQSRRKGGAPTPKGGA